MSLRRLFDGIRILDLTRLLPGAFATALLADLGADVIKIEQPGSGDPMRAYEPKIGSSAAYTWVTDRNKRSLELDLRERGGETCCWLVQDADALIESLPAGGDGAARARVRRAARGQPGAGVRVRERVRRRRTARAEAGHDINYLGRAGMLRGPSGR